MAPAACVRGEAPDSVIIRNGMHPPIRTPSRRILLLAILATCLHALMPLLMALQAHGGMMMQLCSVQGSRAVFVQWADDADDGSRHPLQDLRPLCPLCLAGAHLALNAPVAPALLLLAGLRHASPASAVHSVFQPAFPALFLARAPPLPA